VYRLQGSGFLKQVTHLIRRFFGTVFARRLDDQETTQIAKALGPALAPLFFSMSTGDQRHALNVWRRLAYEQEIAEAALLHDVGKVVSQLGPVSRACATVCGAAGIRTSGRWAAYLDHGKIGARMLEDAGAGEVAIAFARFHPGPAPAGIDETTWYRLAAADEA